MCRLVLIVLMTLLSLTIGAQTRKIKGEYTFYSSPDMSPKEAMAAAIENARVQALANEFGTLITQSTLQEERLNSSGEDSYFMQLNASEVKGEWLEDTKKPEAKIVDTTDEGILVIKAKVEGRARALSNEAATFEALTLRNGTELRMASTEFRENDRLFLYFKAPADGYVAVYLIDESRMASCLIPHEDDGDGQQPVEHGKEYIFFSEQHDADFNGRDGLKILCDNDKMEVNRIYVIYSPNPFIKANDKQGQLLDKNLHRPRQLSIEDFTKWMSRLCGHDQKMGRKVIHIKIKK